MNLTGNELESIAFLAAAPSLQFLNVSNNKIRDLAGLELCKNLTEIFARNNDISSLAALGSSRNLTLADFAGNSLASLKELSRLLKNKDLQYLSVAENPLPQNKANIGLIFPDLIALNPGRLQVVTSAFHRIYRSFRVLCSKR